MPPSPRRRRPVVEVFPDLRTYYRDALGRLPVLKLREEADALKLPHNYWTPAEVLTNVADVKTFHMQARLERKL